MAVDGKTIMPKTDMSRVPRRSLIHLRQNRIMRCLLLLVTALVLSAAGEMSLTVDKLTDFIRSAVKLKQTDKEVAETLRHVKMVEKLDDRTIEELQSLGAGPKTVAALKELGDASSSLPQAVPPPPKPVVVPIPPNRARSSRKRANTSITTPRACPISSACK